MTETALLYIVLSHLSLIMHNQKGGSPFYMVLSFAWLALALINIYG